MKTILLLSFLSFNAFSMEPTLPKDLAIKIINKNCNTNMKMTQKHIKDPDNVKILISLYNYSCNNLTAKLTKVSATNDVSIYLFEKNTKTMLPEINKTDSIDVALVLLRLYAKSKESIADDIAIKKIIEKNKKETIEIEKMVESYHSKQKDAINRLSN